MKKRVKRKGRRSVIEKNTADFNKEFRSQPRRGLGEKKNQRIAPRGHGDECLAHRTLETERKKEKLENSTLLSLPSFCFVVCRVTK